MLKLAKPVVIIGLGETGLACLRFLKSLFIDVSVVDSRLNPPNLSEALKEFPEVKIQCGSFDTAEVQSAATLVISPGVSMHQEIFEKAQQRGAEIIGDVELFARSVTAPVIAITGSNGKTTVTKLVAELLQAAGKKVAVGGNIGTPCLELISNKEIDIFVLELSSFQLETTSSLKPIVATVLNISPDHLDRYQGMDEYLATKLSIFKNTTIAITPAGENWDLRSQNMVKIFALTGQADYSVIEIDQQKWVSVAGEPWMAISALQLFGKHNQLNVLAALALVDNVGIDLFGNYKQALMDVLKNFKGLPHRCEVIAHKKGVLWVNDSKATNVASARAAIESFAEKFSGKIVLIAGGDSKNADLSSLQESLNKHVSRLITFGLDGDKIAALISNQKSVMRVIDLPTAVIEAEKTASEDSVVLLAPACSSLDMFSNYEARGRCFTDAVEALAA